MILDYNYSKKKRNFSISYITETGGKKVLNFNVDKFKTFYSTPNGKYENWDGSRCNIKYTENPSKFDIKTFIEEMSPKYKKLLEGHTSPKVYTFDIETKLNENRDFPDPVYAREEITTISIVSPDLNCIVLGTTPLDENGNEFLVKNFKDYINNTEFYKSLGISQPYVKYIYFEREEDMLKYFLQIVSQVPILSGWNCIQFDWNYITHRIRNYFPDLSITLSSCTQSLVTKRYENQKGEKLELPMPQHTLIIDMMEVMDMDYTVMPIKESKSLEYISSQTPGLGIHKIQYDGDLQDLYELDYPRYVFYNAIDSILVQLINYRYKTLDNVYLQARYCHTKIQDCFSKIAMSESLVFLDFYERGIKVVDNGVKVEDRGRLLGAYVKNPITGVHSYVTCNDFASLYPSTIRTCNLSFENFVGEFYDHDKLKPYESDWRYIVIGPNVFRNDGTAVKPSLGQFVDKFIDEQRLKPYRDNKNYFVTVNGCVYKNDKDYSFRRIQAQLKSNRDRDKYLAKQLDAKVIYDIEHLGRTENQKYPENIIECIKTIDYNITCTNDLLNIQDINEFKKKLKDKITYLSSAELAMKYLMNSMYGGSSHKSFFWFNIHLANDITGESRNLIHLMEHHIPDFWRNNWLKLEDLHKKLGITVDEKQALKALDEAKMQWDDLDAYHEKSWVTPVYGDTDSLYLSYNQLLKSIKGYEKMSIEQKRNIIVRLNTEFMDKHNCEFIKEYYDKRFGKSVHEFELETVALSGIWLDIKKRYAQLLLWKDGKNYDVDNLPMKVKGLEMIKSSYPKLARENLMNTIRFLLENASDPNLTQKINIKVQEVKQKYLIADIEDICLNQNVKGYNKYIINDKEDLVFAGKASPGVKAIGFYNWLRYNFKLPGDPIYSGKVKLYVIKNNNKKGEERSFAFISQHYPKWAEQYAPIDRVKMFQKTFLDPLNRIITTGANLSELKSDGYIQTSLF